MGIALSDNYHHFYAEKTHKFVPDTIFCGEQKLGRFFWHIETKLSRINYHKVEKKSQLLNYLIVSFCIIYNLQKMLGCSMLTLEMDSTLMEFQL